MDSAVASALCDELYEMIGDGPGDIPGSRERIAVIAALFSSHPNGYVREKARDATEFLDMWRSPRKWQQWGQGPTHLCAMVRNSVGSLRMAIQSFGSKSTDKF